MKDPRNIENVTYEIAYAQFYPEGLISIQYEIDGIEDMLTLDASVKDFDLFCPKEECNLLDDEGNFTARFDQFLNLHWLVENEGHVMYRVVNCNNIVDELIHARHV
jgi:hypothetical protein